MRPKERLLLRRSPTPIKAEDIRKALEEWSDRLSRWEAAFTALVVLGLAIEYLPQLAHAIEWMRALKFDRVDSHVDLLNQLGGFLVVSGVAGELVVSIMASRVETDLREESNAALAEANVRAAEATLASRKLEAMMVDRKLSNPVGFIEAMRAFSGTEVTFTVGDDSESRRLLSRLEVDLTAAGWRISGIPQRRLTLPDCIMVSLPANDWYRYSPLRNAAVALGDWLNADGIITAPEFRDMTDFTGIVINVGARPSTLTAFEALQNGWRWTLDQLRMQ